MNKYECKVLRKGKGVTFINDKLVVFERGKFSLLDIKKNKSEYLCKLQLSLKTKILLSFRLTQRMFRLEPRTGVQVNNDEVVFSFKGKILKLNIEDKNINVEHELKKGMNNPLNFCKLKGIKGFNDCILYGEYTQNENKDEVKIFSRKLNDDKWEPIYIFGKGTIKHIHNIVSCPPLEGVLILTGDNNGESGIWLAKDNFNKVEKIFYGDKKYRTCNIFPLSSGLLYATDDPDGENYIRLIDYKNRSEKNLYELNGPSIFSTKCGNLYFFSNSVEPDSNLSKYNYLLTNKAGKGSKNKIVELVYGNIEDGFKVIMQLKKDVLPMSLFQFGNIQLLSYGEELILSAISVKDYDGKLVKISNFN